MEERIKALTGNEAMAEAMRQINPDVVAAYPITPATEVVQIFASFVADGKVSTEFVPAESEHSALSACVGAAAAGARVMTSTASQGLALMHEILYIAAALRLPIVICEINRSLSAPINIHCDHSDTMGSRDSGWIQIYAEDSQEAYDLVIQAVRIAEDTFIPVMVTLDGFIISHCMQRIDMLTDEEVQTFIGEHKSPYSLLDLDNPITVGSLDLQDYFFEHKRSEIEAIGKTGDTILKVGKDFGEQFGRSYGHFEPYKLDDAELCAVTLGSTSGTAKIAVDQLRQEGVRAGLLKIRVFRPLPHAQLAQILSPIPVVAVLDRSDTLSTLGGPVFMELRSCLYETEKRPKMVDYIYGLGGRDIGVDDIKSVFHDCRKVLTTGKVKSQVSYLGVRE